MDFQGHFGGLQIESSGGDGSTESKRPKVLSDGFVRSRHLFMLYLYDIVFPWVFDVNFLYNALQVAITEVP